MMAATYRQLVRLAEEQLAPDRALAWVMRCAGFSGRDPAEIGADRLDERWREITGTPLPASVRDYMAWN